MIKKLKVEIFIVCVCCILLIPTISFAIDKPTINILTWWGYLDQPEIINQLEKDCNVHISYDEYYSNSEFMNRKNLGNYDIYIFSNPLYNVIKNEIKMAHSDLWKESEFYIPTIRKRYLQSHFPPNVVYFMHALTGFLWNPTVINISKKDSVFDIFRKAGENLVVMMDDPWEEAKLFNLNFGMDKYSVGKELTQKNFRALTQNTKVYVTNDFIQITQKPNFAFAFTWSGEAININSKRESNRKFKFLVHPRLSYVTSDLLAQISPSPYANCVAKKLTSKEIMKIFQNHLYYFSSYGDYSTSSLNEYKDTNKLFLNELEKLSWNENVSAKNFGNMNKQWKLIKIAMNK